MYRKSYERECISWFIGKSDVLKVLKIAIWELQNITSDHKSRNARAGSYDFLFIIFSTKLLHRATLHALRTTKKHFNGFQNAHMFYLNQSKM